MCGASGGAGGIIGGAVGEAENEDAAGEESGEATRVWQSGGADEGWVVGQKEEAGEGECDVCEGEDGHGWGRDGIVMEGRKDAGETRAWYGRRRENWES